MKNIELEERIELQLKELAELHEQKTQAVVERERTTLEEAAMRAEIMEKFVHVQADNCAENKNRTVFGWRGRCEACVRRQERGKRRWRRGQPKRCS